MAQGKSPRHANLQKAEAPFWVVLKQLRVTDSSPGASGIAAASSFDAFSTSLKNTRGRHVGVWQEGLLQCIARLTDGVAAGGLQSCRFRLVLDCGRRPCDRRARPLTSAPRYQQRLRPLIAEAALEDLSRVW